MSSHLVSDWLQDLVTSIQYGVVITASIALVSALVFEFLIAYSRRK